MIDPQTYDWTRFEIVFYYDQPVEEVFQYWATGAGLESFFIEKARYVSADGVERSPDGFVEAGDSYRWEWRQPFDVEGKVLSITQNQEAVFTFGSMKVNVLFSNVGNQTELRLIQTDIPETDDGRVMGHLNCRSCWVFFLTNLKSVLETGLDLRDQSPDRVSSMEVVFLALQGQ